MRQTYSLSVYAISLNTRGKRNEDAPRHGIIPYRAMPC